MIFIFKKIIVGTLITGPIFIGGHIILNSKYPGIPDALMNLEFSFFTLGLLIAAIWDTVWDLMDKARWNRQKDYGYRVVAAVKQGEQGFKIYSQEKKQNEQRK